jgi:hypothetical protein
VAVKVCTFPHILITIIALVSTLGCTLLGRRAPDCFLFFFICPIIFILLTDDDKGQQGRLYGVLIFISVFFIAVYGGIFLWAESKYRAWKKWAKLRGWKELSKSERIKRGAKKR